MTPADPETEAVDLRRKVWNGQRLGESWVMETGIRREDGLSLLAVLGDAAEGSVPAVPGATRQTLCENEWVSLKVVRKPGAGVNGYVYSHETRCQGRIVAVLPYRDAPAGREYLVKSEMTPCWGFSQVLSAITGGYEGGVIEDDAVREMMEETGYAITADDLIPLGESYASKSADTVYSLFSVDLTGLEPGEAIGDGTRVEAESAAVWLTAGRLADIMDPQVAVMYVRLVTVALPVAAVLDPKHIQAALEALSIAVAGAEYEHQKKRYKAAAWTYLDALEGKDSAEEERLPRLCSTCLHDGVLERTLGRAEAAEGKLAAVKCRAEDWASIAPEGPGSPVLADAGRAILAITGAEGVEGNG